MKTKQQPQLEFPKQFDLIEFSDHVSKYGHLSLTDPNLPFYDLVLNLNKKLKSCGQWANYNYYHKQCPFPKGDGTIKKVYSQLFCNIRYCVCPQCIVQRFAQQVNEFKTIKRMQNLSKLWHFVIGFEPIPLEDFKKNFSYYKKLYEYSMNLFWHKLVRHGMSIQAVRVLDFAYHEDKQEVYPHYHFGAIPLKGAIRREFMIKLNVLQKDMKSRSRKALPFVFESLGYKPKGAIFSYLAKRCSGMYKFREGKGDNDWSNNTRGKMLTDIKSGKYHFLQDLISPSEYILHFYKKSHYACVGGLPRACILIPDMLDDIPTICPHCQQTLTRHQIMIEVLLNVEPPPNFLKKSLISL